MAAAVLLTPIFGPAPSGTDRREKEETNVGYHRVDLRKLGLRKLDGISTDPSPATVTTVN